MSTSPPEPPQRSAEPPPAPEFDIPNAEKYMLEADVMRRRQLRSALLHGSRRTWREHRKVWPGVVAGLVAVGLIIAVIAVKTAYDKDKASEEQAAVDEFCSTSLDEESFLSGEFDIHEPSEVESAASSARNLLEIVPDHLADEIEDDIDTIADQYEAMDAVKGDPDRLDELSRSDELDKARADLQKFNDEYCDQ